MNFVEREFQMFKDDGRLYCVEYKGFNLWGKYLYKPNNKEVFIICILPEEQFSNSKNIFISSEEGIGFGEWLDITEANRDLKYLNEVKC